MKSSDVERFQWFGTGSPSSSTVTVGAQVLQKLGKKSKEAPLSKIGRETRHLKASQQRAYATEDPFDRGSVEGYKESSETRRVSMFENGEERVGKVFLRQ